MRTIGRDRLLYAGLTFAIVFGSYLWTLAPTLTFWDAGEFIATSYILGIPHPPGTPLFVLVGHVFGMLPLGVGFAVKLNLMSALASSITGLLYFLVVDQVVAAIDRERGWELPPAIRHVAAMGAVCLASWGLTMWYNSTETEVYTVALMTIALVTFLVFYWADHLEEGKDWNLLLLVVYLMGLSIGNHLMALLVMPAVVVYALTVVWPRYRDYAFSVLVGAFGLYLVVMRGISVDGLILGEDPVHGAPMAIGLTVLALGLWWMGRTGALPFFAASILVFVAGASVLLLLKIRAGLDPAINEANPETWVELLAVLARKQYDVRPILPRSVDFFQYQVPLYFDYLFGRIGPFESRVPPQFGLPGLSIVVFGLAVYGAWSHFKAEPRTALYFLLVYLATSLGLVVYLNFPLGTTQAPGVTGLMREVRERDYFFVVSFVFVGLWAGVGTFALLGEAFGRWRERVAPRAALAGALVALLLLPAAVFALNYHQADRRGNYVPRDFAYNLLQTVEPWGILFTNGDNDTFPLWYLQEVEGVRTDVSVVNLALLNTSWYVVQLSEQVFTAGRPPRTVDSIPLTELAGVEPVDRPTDELLDYDGSPDHPLARIGYVIDEATRLDVSGVIIDLPAGSILRRQDVGVLQILRRHLGKRPIYFSVTVPDDGRVRLHDHLLREGIADRITERPVAQLARAGRPYLPMQPPEEAWIDVPRTALLLDEVYRYRGIDDPDVYMDGTARALIGNYGATYLQLAGARARMGETDAAIASLERGTEILGRTPDDEDYLTSQINILAVSGSYGRLDSVLEAAEARRGARLEDRYYKIAGYNAAVAGHVDVADRVLEKYFGDRPGGVESDLWMEIAGMAVGVGDTARGLRFLSAAIRSDPANREALFRYVQLAYAAGRTGDAVGFLDAWIESHPGDSVAIEARRSLERGAPPPGPEDTGFPAIVAPGGLPVDTSGAPE